MHLDLNFDQRAQLELISLHTGKPPAQVLTEAVKVVLDRDVQFWESVQRGAPSQGCQRFLEADELDARLAQLLRR